MAKRLTPKEKGFVKDYLATGNGTEAAIKNYDTTSRKVASVIAAENLAKPRIQSVILDALPDELLSKVHREGLEANRVISANITYGDADEKTNDFIEVPDHAVRHKYLESAYKLKGSFAPEKSLNMNVEIEVTPELLEASRILDEHFKGTGLASDGAPAITVGNQAQN